jgi:ABC-type amino acid transport substrate-binding protein
MRSLFLSLLIFTSAQIAIAQNYKGESWQQVKSKGSGTLSAIYYSTPGLVYEDGGTMKGVCVDLMDEFKKYVKEKHNVSVDYKFIKREQVFSRFIDGVKNSENVMGVCNTSITEDRKNYLSFSPPYMNNPSVLLSNGAAPALKSLEDLSTTFSGYKAIIIKGSTHEKYINQIKAKHYPDLIIEYVNSGEEVNAKLRQNANYFTIIDFTEYYDAVKKKLDVQRHNISLDELQDELAFIFPKNSDWVRVWNEFLTPEFKSSITYKKIVADNLGSSFVNLIK